MVGRGVRISPTSSARIVRARVVVQRRRIDGVREALVYRSSSLPTMGYVGGGGGAQTRPMDLLDSPRIQPVVGEEHYVVRFGEAGALQKHTPPNLVYVVCATCFEQRDPPYPVGAVSLEDVSAHAAHCTNGTGQFAAYPLPARWADARE